MSEQKYNQQANSAVRETIREENGALNANGIHIPLRELVKNFRGFAFQLVIVNTHNTANLRVSVNSRNRSRVDNRGDMVGTAGNGIELTPYGTISVTLTAFQVARHQVDMLPIDAVTKLNTTGNYSLTVFELQPTPELLEP